jgi:hypothetical protein
VCCGIERGSRDVGMTSLIRTCSRDGPPAKGARAKRSYTNKSHPPSSSLSSRRHVLPHRPHVPQGCRRALARASRAHRRPLRRRPRQHHARQRPRGPPRAPRAPHPAHSARAQTLEREKQKNLSGTQHKSLHPNAPGWNDKLASASEAAVKVRSLLPITRACELTLCALRAGGPLGPQHGGPPGGDRAGRARAPPRRRCGSLPCRDDDDGES